MSIEEAIEEIRQHDYVKHIESLGKKELKDLFIEEFYELKDKAREEDKFSWEILSICLRKLGIM